MGNTSFRNHFSKERSCSSTHYMLSYSGSIAPSPSSRSSILNIFRYLSRFSSPAILTPTKRSAQEESDAECWEKMLVLQMEYHCYNSARLEAALQTLEMGYLIEQVHIPSRLCLDLLNEELRAQTESKRWQTL